MRPWHIIVFAIVVLVLFGAGKLPGFARSLGQSLRIFKAETKAMKDDDSPAAATPPGQISAMAQMPVVPPAAAPVAEPVVQPVAQPVVPPVVPPVAEPAQPVVAPEAPATPPRTDG
jgi:sec-independent protein translocase protein TatA